MRSYTKVIFPAVAPTVLRCQRTKYARIQYVLATTTYARYGRPDSGLVSLSELIDCDFYTGDCSNER